MSAHLHRAYQIFCSPVLPGRTVTSASPLSTDLVGVQYALWELIRELSERPLAYPLTIIKSALLGFRNPWAETILKTTRSIVDALISYNEQRHE